jgi:hypothetical protein
MNNLLTVSAPLSRIPPSEPPSPLISSRWLLQLLRRVWRGSSTRARDLGGASRRVPSLAEASNSWRSRRSFAREARSRLRLIGSGGGGVTGGERDCFSGAAKETENATQGIIFVAQMCGAK